MLNERTTRHDHLFTIAKQIMTAARTAPKGKGIDIIELAVLHERKEVEHLAQTMIDMVAEHNMKFFLRDAENILQSEAVILLGTGSQPIGLNCNNCGFATCEQKLPHIPCQINSVDLGIAIGSACATAADLRVDSRVMFSAGLAAKKLNLLAGCQSVYALPISASSKSPFFDRKTQH
jgi:uncharacterized ferredoxin-like protein